MSARIGAAVLLAVFAIGLVTRTGITHVVAQEKATVIPGPAADITNPASSSEVAVLAGGCFWGVQGVYQHVKGVTSAISGYAGGDRSTAHYEVVETSTSGHAESVQITFDPRQISYGRVLQIFFSVAHDPTLINHQGPDWGPQYRSAIFPLNGEQEHVARAYIAQLDQAHVFKKAIATKIELNRPFFAAEDYHQDFLERNPGYPYIVINDLPKIAELKKTFPDLYRASPVLVAASSKP